MRRWEKDESDRGIFYKRECEDGIGVRRIKWVEKEGEGYNGDIERS